MADTLFVTDGQTDSAILICHPKFLVCLLFSVTLFPLCLTPPCDGRTQKQLLALTIFRFVSKLPYLVTLIPIL